MSVPPSFAQDWPELHDAHRRHRARFTEREHAFRTRLSSTLDREIEHFVRSFCGTGALAGRLEPVGRHLRDYLLWLRWSAWLSTTLAPPLELEGEHDALRLSLATVTYLGARLVDDGMDDHRSFKGKTLTLVGRLEGSHPGLDPVVLRCQSALIGFAALHHGIRRLRAAGFETEAASCTRLFGRIIPGIVVESLSDRETLSLEEYQQLVQCKSVAYDMILYRTFLEPLAPTLREPVLDALAAVSEVAQYLNDLVDRADDETRAQPTILHWFGTGVDAPSGLRRHSLERLRQRFGVLDGLPEEARDAVWSVAFQVFKASTRLWASPEEGGTP